MIIRAARRTCEFLGLDLVGHGQPKLDLFVLAVMVGGVAGAIVFATAGMWR